MTDPGRMRPLTDTERQIRQQWAQVATEVSAALEPVRLHLVAVAAELVRAWRAAGRDVGKP